MPAPLKKIEYNSQGFYNCNTVSMPKRKKHINKKNRGRNNFARMLRFIFLSFFLVSFSYIVAPSVYADYFEPLILNHILNKKINLSAKPYIFSYLNYVSNTELFGQNLLVPVNKHTKTIVPIVTSGELEKSKSELQQLFSLYPKMHVSLYVWEYSTARELNINADESFSAASIIKLPILFELFRKIDRSEKDGSNTTILSKKLLYNDINKTSGSGELQYGPLNKYFSVDYLAKVMITHSDNSATNMLIEEAGGMGAINSSMRSLGLDKIELNNRLPDLEGTNKISAKQIAMLLYNLDNPNFLSDKSKITIKEYMANVQNRSLLQAGLPSEAILIHKTGDIGSMLGDAGVVYAQNGRKYIVVMLVERPHNDYTARDLIQKASKIIYDNINSGVDLI